MKLPLKKNQPISPDTDNGNSGKKTGVDHNDASATTDGVIVILTPEEKRDRIKFCLTEVGVSFNTSPVSLWQRHYQIIIAGALLVGESECNIALPFDHEQNIKDAWSPKLLNGNFRHFGTPCIFDVFFVLKWQSNVALTFAHQ